MEIIERAIREGRTLLSEYESKQVLAAYRIPVTREVLIERREDLPQAAHEIGYPLVLKGCSPEISHKTEKGLIRMDIRADEEALEAFDGIIARIGGGGTKKSILVQEMVKGERELLIGLTRDPQFGPCVMFGLGGIFTEILRDVSMRLAPLNKRDALEMMREIKGHRILGPIRGMEGADLEQLTDILVQVGRIGLENDFIKEIDINPLMLADSRAVAVDALVILGGK
jgi:acetyl-CoA synthetase (ADP-forming)